MAIITKREFIMRFLEMIRAKLDERLSKEPTPEFEYMEEAKRICREVGK